YPAFFLARLGLVDILKGYLTKGITTYTIRNFLVSFQFGVSIALLIACWIMANQIVLLKQKETRLPDAHCLRLYHTANIGSADSLFKQQVLTLPGVKSFAYVNQSPPAINWSSVYRKNNEPQELILYTLFAEASIKDVLNLSLVTGRFLTSQDTTQIVINQSAARKLNIHDLSTRQYLTGVDSSAIQYEIVGIVSDFHFQPLHKAIEPLLIHPKTNPSWEAIIRFSDSVNFTQMDAQLSETWKRFSGHVPYQSFYMKDQFRNAFEEEEKASWVLGVFSFLALLIATLGLIGLLTYAIEHKAKEMGVRMVVGADKMQLLILFLKDFSWQVLKAFCIAAPLTWLSMQYWVNTFPYKVPFPFFIFLSVGVGALLIVWLTVAIRVLPFLTKNPALLLRDE
ncbi:MAG: hypothetical protein MUF68_03200, partial [Cyclobacteriaceae bacterium]|nr:hypothetical protein [Cyclobacteriaceae bacterium]